MADLRARSHYGFLSAFALWRLCGLFSGAVSDLSAFDGDQLLLQRRSLRGRVWAAGENRPELSISRNGRALAVCRHDDVRRVLSWAVCVAVFAGDEGAAVAGVMVRRRVCVASLAPWCV